MKKILSAIVFVICFSGLANAQSTLTLQEKCAEGARKYFEESGWKIIEERKDSTWGNSYQCHYNKKLDKCFILITSNELGHERTWRYKMLADVFEGKSYGDFGGFVDGYIMGNILGTPCKSQDECEALIKPYMEE